MHFIVEEDEYVAELHARAEKFDPQAERTFAYLQVGDACTGCTWFACISGFRVTKAFQGLTKAFHCGSFV